MYKCKHGERETTQWCQECLEEKRCDCSTTEHTRFKDIYYGDKDFTCTINIDVYPICGEINNIHE